MERVDLNKVLDRVDVNEVVARIDTDAEKRLIPTYRLEIGAPEGGSTPTR